MKIKTLTCQNFRNYSHLELSLHPQMNVFVGRNAQGKTNILEGIYYLSTLRSFRTSNDSDLIQKNKDYFRIKGSIEKEYSSILCQLLVTENGKSLKLNETIIKKTSDYLGTLNCVIFSPIDLIFFDDSPRNRRRFIDMEASKLSTAYLQASNQYSQLLKERNTLLKREKIDDEVLNILTNRLIDKMFEVVSYRRKMLDYLSQALNKVFNALSSQSLNLSIKYHTVSEEKDEIKFKKQLNFKMNQSKERDKLFRMTHIGCHRDDIECFVEDISASSVLSQGQKRLVMIALKLALVEFIHKQTKELPILLLDDVFSELDKVHQQRFLMACPPSIQTIITTTTLSHLSELTQPMSIYEISKGEVIKRRNING